MSEQDKRNDKFGDDARAQAIRIKKIRQGLIHDTENEAYEKEKAQREATPVSTKDKIKNFWYHNKLFVIIGCFIVVVVSFMTYQSFTKERYDTTLLLCSYSFYDEGTTEQLSQEFGKYMTDTDGNREVNVGVFQANFTAPGEVEDQTGYEQALQSRIMAEIYVGENCIFIMQKEIMDSLAEKEVFADLRELIGAEGQEPVYGVSIANSSLFKDKVFDNDRGDYYVGIRVYKEGTDKAAYDAQVNAVKELLKDNVK
ncbi:MAG: hypothetical protein UHH95_05055 [Oscillospiraceae bacterium]|nr:hypothetical protein [Oscillospiraceae bacterium]